MALFQKVRKRDWAVAVIAGGIGIWFAMHDSNDSGSDSPKVAVSNAVAATPAPQQFVNTNQSAKKEPKPIDPAVIEKKDEEVISRYAYMARQVMNAYPEGTPCHDDATGYYDNAQGELTTHDSFFSSFSKDPQGTVDKANDFSRQNPALHIPLLTVADAPSAVLRGDEKAFSDAKEQFRQDRCLK